MRRPWSHSPTEGVNNATSALAGDQKSWPVDGAELVVGQEATIAYGSLSENLESTADSAIAMMLYSSTDTPVSSATDAQMST